MAHRILGRQDTQKLLDNIKGSYPTVVEELVPGHLSVGGVQKVLQNLLRERVPIRDMVTILETLADHTNITKDPDLLTELVRVALRNTITRHYQTQDGKLQSITVDPRLEQMIEEAARQLPIPGIPVSLAPDIARRVYTELAGLVEQMIARGLTPMVITAPGVRMHFKRLVDPVFPDLVVLSHNELLPTVQVEAAGSVRLQDAD